MKFVKKYLLDENLSEEEKDKISIHLDFANSIINNNQINEENVDNLINNEIGKVFVKVLEDCAVFKEKDVCVLKDCLRRI